VDFKPRNLDDEYVPKATASPSGAKPKYSLFQKMRDLVAGRQDSDTASSSGTGKNKGRNTEREAVRTGGDLNTSRGTVEEVERGASGRTGTGSGLGEEEEGQGTPTTTIHQETTTESVEDHDNEERDLPMRGDEKPPGPADADATSEPSRLNKDREYKESHNSQSTITRDDPSADKIVKTLGDGDRKKGVTETMSYQRGARRGAGEDELTGRDENLIQK
jgi:hypothetical protein